MATKKTKERKPRAKPELVLKKIPADASDAELEAIAKEVYRALTGKEPEAGEKPKEAS